MIHHPAIVPTISPSGYRWTLDELRAAVIAQAAEDARRGISVVPWRGVARSMERLAPDWRDDAHRHPASHGACPLDEVADELCRLYADEERAARLAARSCPACGINPAAPGDRYCLDCGSAADRSAWAADD